MRLPKSRFKILAMVAIVVLGCFVFARWLRFGTPSTPAPSNSNSNPQPPAEQKSAPSAASTQIDAQAAIQRALGLLTASTNPVVNGAELAQLEGILSRAARSEALAAILDFLYSHHDAVTSQEFKVGRDGSLSQAPSLRVFLLDYLTRIDTTAAGNYSRLLLATKSTPDEWAVALRSSALADASESGREFVRQKAEEMVLDQTWQTNPSTGFLEAFDALVYSRDTTFTPTLADLVSSKDNPAVAHAAYLALDRLVQADPVDVLPQLIQSPETMPGREATRADFFARADPRDPQQQSLLEQYLLSPNVSWDEISRFAEVFPSANFMVSNNLLTRSTTPDLSNLAARDAKALDVVNGWLADPRFTQLRGPLQTIQSRLAYFVAQAHR